MKTYLLRISQYTGDFVSFLWKILHFLIFFHVPNTFWWLLNFERYVHVYLSFRCIFLICSCHLNNHPSILWTILYPSPDDGYYNRNVNVDFTSWYIHLFGLYFFLLPSYCRILSIFTFIYIYIYIYIYFIKKEQKLNEIIALYVRYIELFTRKI